MTLPETALAFCRECYWAPHQNAEMFIDSQMIGVTEAITMHFPGTNMMGQFEYSNIASVMAAVRVFCQRSDAEIQVRIMEVGYAAFTKAQPKVLYCAVSERELCEALMLACLEAQRKLRVAA